MKESKPLCPKCKGNVWVYFVGHGDKVAACSRCNITFDLIQCVDPHESILEEAIRLTSKDRQQTYGHPRDHFAKTISLLNSLLKDYLIKPLPVEVWPKIMILDKLARSMNMYKRDNMADVAGYAQTHEMCVED